GYLHTRTVDVGGYGMVTTYQYDAVGNLVRTVDPRGYDTLYEYNSLNQVQRQESQEALPGVRYEMLFSYDANGNRVRVDVQNRDETGTVQPNAYFTTIYEYDTLNRLMRTTRESGDYSGAIPGTPQLPTGTGLPDSEFIRTEYQYDANRNR